MAKFMVKANQDFFDRANQIERKKGSEFILKSDYAESLGKQVTILENLEKKRILKVKEKVDLNAAGKPVDIIIGRVKKTGKKIM